MSNDIKGKIRQMRETKGTVTDYWNELLPGVELPATQLNGWVIRFDLDEIIGGLEAAVLQISKSDANGGSADAVKVASAVMNRIHTENLPEAERERLKVKKAELSAKRSAAGKAGNEKRWKAEQELATACDDLRQDAIDLRTGYGNEYGNGSGGGNGFGHGAHSHSSSDFSNNIPIPTQDQNQPQQPPALSTTPPVPSTPSGGYVWLAEDLDEVGESEYEVSNLVEYFHSKLSKEAQQAAPRNWRQFWTDDFRELVGKPGAEVRAMIDFCLGTHLAKFVVRGKEFVFKYDEYREDWLKKNKKSAKNKVAA